MNEIKRAIEHFESKRKQIQDAQEYLNCAKGNYSLYLDLAIQALQEKLEREENDKTPCKCDKFIKVNVVIEEQAEVEYCKICEKCGKIKYHFCYGHYDYSMSGMIYQPKNIKTSESEE